MKHKALWLMVLVLVLSTLSCLGGQADQNSPEEANAGPGEMEETEEPAEAPTEEMEPTEPPEPTEEVGSPVEFVMFENEVFSISYPEGWFYEVLGGWGFFSTAEELQTTWYREGSDAPLVKEGAFLIIMAGTREDMGISPDASPMEAFETLISVEGEECEVTSGPVEITINDTSFVTIQGRCVTPDGVATVITTTVVLRGDMVATLGGAIAADSEAEYFPVIREMINSFQFKE